MSEHLDLIVIGSGPGGYVAAIRAAQLGLRTAIVERDELGGRCLNLACIPAKTVLRVADVLSEVRGADRYGISVEPPRLNEDALRVRREKVISTLTRGVGGLLAKNGITVLRGTARLSDQGTVSIDGPDARTLQASEVLLATGSVPVDLPGLERGGRVIGTEEAWAFASPPGRLVVVGGGASGVELASAYGRLGSQVTLIEAEDQLLPTEEPEVAALVQRTFERQGIEIRLGSPVSDLEQDADGVRLLVGEERLAADWMVVAAGRRPDVEALGLEPTALVRDSDGRLQVDASYTTSLAGVRAIGDLIPGPALAHKASEEGILAVEAIAGRSPEPLTADDIPRVTFCSPTVASVGLTEAAARAAGHDVVVGRRPFAAIGAGTVGDPGGGFVKLVGERRYGELLGAHLVGPGSSELLQSLVNLRQLEGGYPELARLVHAHPTLSEAICEAARDADGWVVHG